MYLVNGRPDEEKEDAGPSSLKSQQPPSSDLRWQSAPEWYWTLKEKGTKRKPKEKILIPTWSPDIVN